jgi:Family of unknown function (DUF1028)
MTGSLVRLTSGRLIARLAAVFALAIAVPANATWSIILINTRTGEIVLGSATCLTSFDLKAGTPVIVPGFGAVTAQSSVDSTGQNRVFARDQLLMGTDPQEILNRLSVFDRSHQSRQYGIVDTLGRTATFSGTQASQWKGGVTGTFNTPDGPVAYAIQGNILTGQPVVLAAETAVINTAGDLAERLMAGMEAARSMGGDGRCSCNLGPTGCGSPPPSFIKSAHIAYMLIAREGDTPGCHGIYRVARTSWAVATGDLDEDGRPDMVSITSGSPQLDILYNATEAGSPFVLFEQSVTLPSRRSRDVKILDVNGDNLNDIVTADSADGTVSVILGMPGRNFATPVVYAAGASPEKLIVADFDGVNGPDIAAVTVGSQSIAILLNDGTGVYTLSSTVVLAQRPSVIAAGDADGDNDIDLLLPMLAVDHVQILDNDGAGVFTAGMVVPTADGPNSIAVADLDNDNDLDMVVGTSTASVVSVFLRQGAGYVQTDYPLGSRAFNVSIGNINGDAIPDIVVFRAAVPDLAVFKGVGSGVFALDGEFVTQYNAIRVTVDDLDGDGLDDIAGGSIAKRSAVIIENETKPGGPSLFTDGQGCAQGDWYMDFNVAFQSPADPDPVFQLQDLFTLWRADLVGRPDAVRSRVTFSSPVMRASHGSYGGDVETMRIELVDWQGLPIAAPLASPPAVTGTGILVLNAPVSMGNGVWEVPVRARGQLGTESLTITVDDGIRPVTLMPNPTVEVTCYADCDQSTGVGTLDIFDFLCYQSAFVNQEKYACDCDSGGGGNVCDIFDFLCFQNAFAQGCP